MSSLTRRGFLAATGAVSVGGLLTACSGGGSAGPGGSGSAGALQWWDHFSGLQDLHARWSEQLAEQLGVTIDYTYNEASRAAEALQLANQANQLPDVYSNVVGLPLSGLVDAGWVQEIPVSQEARDRLPEGSFVEGVTMLDDKVYGMPVLSDRVYTACTWYNREIAEMAGIGQAPNTYDELLAALRAVAGLGDQYAPMTFALGAAGRTQELTDDFAQAGGFPGFQGLRYDTGEYEYQHEAYLTAIELLKEISDSGWLLPGTNQLAIADARTRWAAGTVAFAFDGSFGAGAIRNLAPDFLPMMQVGAVLTPNGEDRVMTRGAPGATWVMAGNADDPGVATQVLESFTTDEYQAGLATAMDAPPINVDTVAAADVIEPYRFLVQQFADTVFRAPQPQVANVGVSDVLSRMTTVSPNLGEIVQGYLGGNVTDLRAALTTLSDGLSATREDAVEAVSAEGVEVSLEDWAFPDWTRGQDYTY